MKKLNYQNNAYKERLRKYILETLEFPDNPEVRYPREKLKAFNKRFNKEACYPYNIKRKPILKDRISDWLQGMPFNFVCYNYEVLEIAKMLHERENFTEAEEDELIENWWDTLANEIIYLTEVLCLTY